MSQLGHGCSRGDRRLGHRELRLWLGVRSARREGREVQSCVSFPAVVPVLSLVYLYFVVRFEKVTIFFTDILISVPSTVQEVPTGIGEQRRRRRCFPSRRSPSVGSAVGSASLSPGNRRLCRVGDWGSCGLNLSELLFVCQSLHPRRRRDFLDFLVNTTSCIFQCFKMSVHMHGNQVNQFKKKIDGVITTLSCVPI